MRFGFEVAPVSDPIETLRADKWLWFARFFKSRSLSAKVITEGKLRINGERRMKASVAVTPGDVLTFPQAERVKVIKIIALGTRRGPAPEAQALYEDLSEPDQPKADIAARVGERPTKRDRRRIDAARDIWSEGDT